MENFGVIRKDIYQALEELLAVAKLKPEQIVVIGCSTSEILGERIGKASSLEVAKALLESILPLISKNKLFLAVQGCEHINRALVVEAKCVEKYNLEQVNVVPHIHAGGGFAAAVYASFKDPVMVENIRADAGMDIGDTFIGMHLKEVAVPIRSEIKNIGKAHLTMARTRTRYIGGERAKYLK